MEDGDNTRWATWANLLSVVRLVIVIPTVYAVLQHQWLIAAACFVVAVVTDLMDGVVARRRNEVTPLGGLLDHGSDAVFVACCLTALAMLGRVPLLLPILVATAFVQYVLDSKALSGAVLRTSAIGRWNGVAYYVVVGIPVISEALMLGWPPQAWVTSIAWLLILSTAVSMADRARALLSAT